MNPQLINASRNYLKNDKRIIDGNGVEYIKINIPLKNKVLAVGFTTFSIIIPDLSIGFLFGKAVMSPIKLRYRISRVRQEVRCMGLVGVILERKSVLTRGIRRKVRSIRRFFR